MSHEEGYLQALKDVLFLTWCEHDPGGWSGCRGHSNTGEMEWLSMDDFEELFTIVCVKCDMENFLWTVKEGSIVGQMCYTCEAKNPQLKMVRKC